MMLNFEKSWEKYPKLFDAGLKASIYPILSLSAP